ncbi:cupin domain-containing protein [Altererythrobacter sp. MF3-039]|uniref:cupin domain-containing protein n=1 Tax=Altererythrobacter sp. MF3-039 TaxID=3252901 RepID=UPI00390CAA2F
MRQTGWIAALICFALIACEEVPQPAQDEAGELEPLRRIITTEDSDGRAVVLDDGPSANVLELNGSRVVRLWETRQLPVPIPVSEDKGATAENGYRDGFIGSSVYYADLPVGSGLDEVPIHKLDSMDYIVLLEGEVDLVLEGGERIPMKPGELLIQAGNNHSWVNTGNTPARLLCIILTGERTGAGVEASE